MPRPLTEQERRAFLDEPHVAVLAVASDDARPPLAVPVWFVLQDDGDLFFFTGATGIPVRKTGLIERAGVLSLAVQKEDSPYKYVTAECSLLTVHRPPSAEQLLSVASRYLPKRQAQGFVRGVLRRAGPELVGFTLRPDRWLSLDFSE
jgi:uncharacterized protein